MIKKQIIVVVVVSSIYIVILLLLLYLRLSFYILIIINYYDFSSNPNPKMDFLILNNDNTQILYRLICLFLYGYTGDNILSSYHIPYLLFEFIPWLHGSSGYLPARPLLDWTVLRYRWCLPFLPFPVAWCSWTGGLQT